VTDTAPDVQVRLDRLFESCSGSDRVRMACEMFDLARALMVANIRAQDAAISAGELRVKVFDRTYEGDFGPEERLRIAARLRR